VRVHHLNCATMCPPSELLTRGEGGLFAPGLMICHCLLVETSEGLVLVDTGLGTGDLADPARLGRGLRLFAQPRLDPAEPAIRQIERLGLDPRDVRHLVVTHLDVDHAGALGDFPWAKVHLHEPEHAAAMARATFWERHRYIPEQWAHGPSWVMYRTAGERWFGFDCVRSLEGLPPEILIVPLAGHSRGHSGVAVDAGSGWMLHGGDAYFFHGEIHAPRSRCPAGFAAFQRVIATDDAARVQNQRRLRELARDHGAEVRIFCAHDPVELERERAVAVAVSREPLG
jgi:glyoxylase-like metal-dependent hydrolase (beta-lactamase superfamily II)